MLKVLLLLLLFWLAARFVVRLVRGALFFRDLRPDGGERSPFGGSRRKAQVEETEYEVLDSRLKDDEGPRR